MATLTERVKELEGQVTYLLEFKEATDYQKRYASNARRVHASGIRPGDVILNDDGKWLYSDSHATECCKGRWFGRKTEKVFKFYGWEENSPRTYHNRLEFTSKSMSYLVIREGA